MAEALLNVAAIVFGALKEVAEAAQVRRCEGDIGVGERYRLMPTITLPLYFLCGGINLFEIVTDMALGENMFLVHDASGFLLHSRYAPPFLLGTSSHPQMCVTLPSRAQVLILWIVTTCPARTPHPFGLHAPQHRSNA